MRRCLRDRRPSLIEPPACNRVKWRALRPALRPRQLKLPAVRRCSQNEGKSCLRLGTTSEPSLCPTTKLPRWGRTLRPRFLRGATLSPLKVESEPSWLATSSVMSSNPASVGSGGCPASAPPRIAGVGRNRALGGLPQAARRGRRRPSAHRPGQTRRWLGPHGAGITHHAAATARVQSNEDS